MQIDSLNTPPRTAEIVFMHDGTTYRLASSACLASGVRSAAKAYDWKLYRVNRTFADGVGPDADSAFVDLLRKVADLDRGVAVALYAAMRLWLLTR